MTNMQGMLLRRCIQCSSDKHGICRSAHSSRKRYAEHGRRDLLWICAQHCQRCTAITGTDTWLLRILCSQVTKSSWSWNTHWG